MSSIRTALIVSLLFAATADADKPGRLVVPKLVQDGQPGFVAPKVWIYDEVGTLLPSDKSQGAYDVGEYVSLPEGWYLVELANVQHKDNRAKIFVKSKRTTVVPTGLVAIAVEPHDQQPRDVCNRWTGHLFVSLPVDPKPGPVIGTNREARGERLGIVQLIAGYYRIQWNRFYVAADVKANHLFTVPTGLVGPMPTKGYTLHAKKGHAPDNPGLRLCESRPTRVIARSYHGTYNKQITQFPFKQRVWEQLTIELPDGTDKAYRKERPVRKIRGPIYKGKGSEPVLMWEVEPPPEPDVPLPGSKLVPNPTP